MKVVFFLELSIFNAFPMLYFRLTRKEIYYLTASKVLQNKNRIQFFDKLGIKWLSFQDFHLDSISEVWTKTPSLCMQVADILSKKNSFALLRRQLYLDKTQDQCLQACIERRIYPTARLFCLFR